MSVRGTHYVLVGTEVAADLDDYNIWDAWDDLGYLDPDNEETPFIFSDMDGEYTYVGMLVAYGDEYEGMPLTEVSVDDLVEYTKQAKELLEKFEVKTKDDNIRLICVTNWT